MESSVTHFLFIHLKVTDLFLPWNRIRFIRNSISIAKMCNVYGIFSEAGLRIKLCHLYMVKFTARLGAG
jgi:hypothetical protein